MQALESLRWEPRWDSRMGCLKGCLDYLGVPTTTAWLYGASGHAFVLNIHEVVCPSGPTAWGGSEVSRLGCNVGYQIEEIVGHKSQADFREKQALAWEKVCHAIDAGRPCFGWELDIPESYVIYGYDEVGYHFRGPGCDEGQGPKPWRELAETGIGWLEVTCVEPSPPAEDRVTVRQALDFALDFGRGWEGRVNEGYSAGLAGYDTWLRALRAGQADGFGMAYNAQVWAECREFAVEFFREARQRLAGVADADFDEAIGHYQMVSNSLQQVAEAFPFIGMQPEHVQDAGRLRVAGEALQRAQAAERAGLAVLERIAGQL